MAHDELSVTGGSWSFDFPMVRRSLLKLDGLHSQVGEARGPENVRQGSSDYHRAKESRGDPYQWLHHFHI